MRARDAQKTLDVALAALKWARQYREQAQFDSGAKGEIWDWYCRGSQRAAEHDYACVEESLRKHLGLEVQPAPAPEET